ncbi:MAG: hypothetical protein WBD74_05085, partial [Candidatus Aquilonibacter sp.]
ANPLDVSSDDQRCPADAHVIALQLSNELKAYVAQIEAAKTATGYPATMPAPAITDATVTYHGLGDTYALSIVPHFTNATNTGRLASQELAVTPQPRSSSAPGRGGGGGGAIRVFFGCLPFHIVQQDDVTSRHLYAPPNTVFGLPPITFMPAVGLYAVPRQQQAGQESFRVYTLPKTPLKDPFEVRTASECTGDMKNTATQALGELRAYFVNGTAPHLWTITAHTAKNGTWYDLAPGDPAMIFSLLFCGRVAATTPQELIPTGWDGMIQPDLNYNAAYGLYLVRPQPRQPNPNASPRAGSGGQPPDS